jgi:hypothetical protein
MTKRHRIYMDYFGIGITYKSICNPKLENNSNVIEYLITTIGNKYIETVNNIISAIE